MVIVKLIGGLGNQMFQYATGRRLAVKNKTVLKLDLSHYDKVDPKYRKYDLSLFNIEENLASAEEINNIKKNGWIKFFEVFKPYRKRTTIKYRGYDFDPHILELGDNVHLDGYWQSEKYFLDVKDTILKDFTLKNPLSNSGQEISKQIKNAESVSIHVRRGDYITSPKFLKIYNLLGLEYYQLAIKKISELATNPAFFIFSDDPEWVENNLSLICPNIYIVSQLKIPTYEELILMSQCQHQIIANSSFSWWAAWLNQNPNKIVIGPKKWFKFCDDDRGIMPEEWLKL